MEKKWQILRFARLMSLWGVATGFAVFFHVQERAEYGIGSFVIGLLIAAVAAYIVETIREKLYGRGSHDNGEVSPGRILSTIVLLATLELVIASWEQIAEIFHHPEKIQNLVLGAALPAAFSRSGILQLVVFGAFWMTIGAAVSMAIARSSLGLDQPDLQTKQRTLRSLRAGLIWAAALTAVYLIGAHLILTIWTLLTSPKSYAPGFVDELVSGGNNWLSGAVFMIASVVEEIAHWHPGLSARHLPQ